MFRSVQELKIATAKVQNALTYLDRYGIHLAVVHGLLGEQAAHEFRADNTTYTVEHGQYQLEVDIHAGTVSLIIQNITVSSQSARGYGIPPRTMVHAYHGCVRLRMNGFGPDLRTCKVNRVA